MAKKGSRWAALFSISKKVNGEVKPNHSNVAHPSKDKFTLTSIEKGRGLPTAADFVSVLRDFTAFNNKEKRELMGFERKLAFFHAYDKNGGIVPLGRFTSKNIGRVTPETYYVHVYPICSGSTNDSEREPQSPLRNVTFDKSGADIENKLLAFGRLIVEDIQTYWIVAMDAKHELYALRAENISPDEEYDEDLDFTPKTGTTASNGFAVSRDPSSLVNGSQNGNGDGNGKKVLSMTSFDSSKCIDTIGGRGVHNQESAGSADDFGRNDYPARTPHSGLDGGYNKQDGTRMNRIVQHGAPSSTEIETPKRSTSSKTFGLSSTQIEVIFSKKHGQTVNVFDATNDQQVFKLGPLNLLDDALKNPDQELSPEPCSDIEAWISTAITSSSACM